MAFHAALNPIRSRRKALGYGLLVLCCALMLVALPTPNIAGSVETDPYFPRAPRTLPGWQPDFIDNFAGTSLNTNVWGRYQGGAPAGSLAVYQPANITVDHTMQADDGVLKLTTKKVNGQWTSAGMSSGRGFSAAQGKWVIKAKFQRAPGVSYNFLLLPKGGGWPPEVNIAEGTAGGPHIMGVTHYGTASNNQQVQRWLKGVDMTKWHTYGVVIGNGKVSFTLDGHAWGVVENSAATPTVPMWLGIQAGVKNCAVSTGECLSAATPTSSSIMIDWVAHYRRI
jgi:beta-glucanase (GH16 family)